jgi:hypothetical protein
LTATGYPASTFSEIGALPSGVTLNTTGTLSGTPAAGTGGVYPITITATDGVSPNAMKSFTLTVDQPPAITSASTATFTVGVAGSFIVTATGYPAPTVSETGLPNGLTFIAGVLSGTPAAGTGGTYNIPFTAGNGVGSNFIQTFTLYVQDFTISASPLTETISAGHSATYTVSLTSLGGLTGSVSLSCAGNPPNSTCTISPSPVMLNGTAKTTITLFASQKVNHGTFPLTFTGALASPSLSHTSKVSLTVK